VPSEVGVLGALFAGMPSSFARELASLRQRSRRRTTSQLRALVQAKEDGIPAMT
jgi:hypothetical protein